MGTTQNINYGNWVCLDDRMGVQLTTVITSVSLGANPSPVDLPLPLPRLGDRCQGNLGSEWLFVRASTTVTQNNALAIDVNFQCNDLTSALITSGLYSYGIAAFTATSANTGEYFWACLNARGGLFVNVTDTAARGAIMYVSVGTPGSLTTTATATQVDGIRPNTSMSSTTTTVDVVMTGYITVFTSA